ncbi:MAG: UDP-N-acetylmuramyl-tripeptide synthetase, partial [Actinobacteria bacterium]
MRTEPVTLGAIASRLGVATAAGELPITSVSHDSRAVRPGGLFVAIRGSRSDGHDHIDEAVAAGAVALVVEHRVDRTVPQLVVADSRAALAPAAAAVYHEPSRRMRVVGVTGTNGKTTVTHILESIAGAAGIRFGIVGTVGARIAGRPVSLARTTPEASDLQRLMADMVADGVTAAAIEVSSHALDLHRVDAVSFSTVAFTNLSQDHLDFHIDMERYYRAKASLFTAERAAGAVIAVDDAAGRRLAAETDLPTVTVSASGAADVVAVIEDADLSGSTIELRARSFRDRLRFPLAGRFNA